MIFVREKEAALLARKCLLSQYHSSNSWYYTHSVITIKRKSNVKLSVMQTSRAHLTFNRLFFCIRELTHFQDQKYDLHVSMTLTPARVAEEEREREREKKSASCCGAVRAVQTCDSCRGGENEICWFEKTSRVHCQLKQTLINGSIWFFIKQTKKKQ